VDYLRAHGKSAADAELELKAYAIPRDRVAPSARDSFPINGARGCGARRHKRGTGLPAIESLISV
jgi:hypothetical protein